LAEHQLIEIYEDNNLPCVTSVIKQVGNVAM